VLVRVSGLPELLTVRTMAHSAQPRRKVVLMANKSKANGKLQQASPSLVDSIDLGAATRTENCDAEDPARRVFCVWDGRAKP
jgi:hypothetical protein